MTERIKQLHEQENIANLQLGKLDKQIRHCEKMIESAKKKKIRVRHYIRGNMLLRNKLINDRTR